LQVATTAGLILWAWIEKRPSARTSRSHHFMLTEMSNVRLITGDKKKYVNT